MMIMKWSAYKRLEKEESDVIGRPLYKTHFFYIGLYCADEFLHLICHISLLLHFFHWCSFLNISPIKLHNWLYNCCGFLYDEECFFQLNLPVFPPVSVIFLQCTLVIDFYSSFPRQDNLLASKSTYGCYLFLLQKCFSCSTMRHFAPYGMVLAPALLRFPAESIPSNVRP